MPERGAQYAITVQNEGRYPVEATRLIAACAAALDHHPERVGIDAAGARSGVTIVLTDNETVARLNRQFRGIDAPTDVLSFPADIPPIALPTGEGRYWGDLVIAFPYAAAQASREGHDLMDSLCLLVVHGTLHLLGFDHDTPERRAEMWASQEHVLRALGISTTLVPALEGQSQEDSHAELD